MSNSKLEETLAMKLTNLNFPEPMREHRFREGRKWSFDFAWTIPNYCPGADSIRGVALEVEGGTWRGGRHSRGSGFAADCEKYNAAATDGWLVLRATSEMISGDDLYEVLFQALQRIGVIE